jgi:hypothetical protein
MIAESSPKDSKDRQPQPSLLSVTPSSRSSLDCCRSDARVRVSTLFVDVIMAVSIEGSHSSFDELRARQHGFKRKTSGLETNFSCNPYFFDGYKSIPIFNSRGCA